MPLKFCELCESYLELVIDKSSIKFICRRCKKEHSASPEDSLLFYEEYDKATVASVEFDETNQIDKINCPECDNNYVRWELDKTTGSKLYMCSCGTRF